MSKDKQQSIIEEFSQALNNTPSNYLRGLSLDELQSRKQSLTRRMKTLTLCNSLALDQVSDATWDGLVENVLVFSSLLKPSCPWAITLFNSEDFKVIKPKLNIKESQVIYVKDFDIVVVCSDSVPQYSTENQFKSALQKCYNTHLTHQIKKISLEISQIDQLTTKKAA